MIGQQKAPEILFYSCTYRLKCKIYNFTAQLFFLCYFDPDKKRENNLKTLIKNFLFCYFLLMYIFLASKLKVKIIFTFNTSYQKSGWILSDWKEEARRWSIDYHVKTFKTHYRVRFYGKVISGIIVDHSVFYIFFVGIFIFKVFCMEKRLWN